MAGYVSEAVIKRLPAYYRHLKELEKEGIHQISSQGLGNRMHLTASQIRQDINCFGGFGRQGYGYSVSGLREHIGHILGVDRTHRMIIVGAGSLVVQDVEDLKRYLDENTVDIAVIAVPVSHAQRMVEVLCERGVKGFWNFAPLDLKVPEGTSVVNVHLDEGLEILSFRMLRELA